MKIILLVILKAVLIFLFLLIGILVLSYRSDLDAEGLVNKYSDEYSHFLEIDSVRVHVKVKGEGEPIFLIHGSFSSLHTWEAWEKELSPYFMTISMDLPGHGLTGPDPKMRYGIEDYASLVFKIADQLGIGEFHVAGNSMGGGVALKMASDQPDRILTLNLIDSSGANLRLDQDEKNKTPQNNSSGALIFKIANHPILNKLMLKCTPEFVFKLNLKQVYYDDSKIREDQVRRYYELMRREGNRKATLDRLTTRKPYQVEFNQINMPVLIMWGAQDQWIPLSQGEKLANMISDSILKVFDQAGHVPMEEIPTESVAEYLSFLGIQMDVDYLSPPKFFSYAY